MSAPETCNIPDCEMHNGNRGVARPSPQVAKDAFRNIGAIPLALAWLKDPTRMEKARRGMSMGNFLLIVAEMGRIQDEKQLISDDECRCPDCAMQWRAPATPGGGPLMPAKMTLCTYCGWVDPQVLASVQKYQDELANPAGYQHKILAERLGGEHADLVAKTQNERAMKPIPGSIRKALEEAMKAPEILTPYIPLQVSPFEHLNGNAGWYSNYDPLPVAPYDPLPVAPYDPLPVAPGEVLGVDVAKTADVGFQLFECAICDVRKEMPRGVSDEEFMQTHLVSPEHDRATEKHLRHNVEMARINLYDYLKLKGRAV